MTTFQRRENVRFRWKLPDIKHLHAKTFTHLPVTLVATKSLGDDFFTPENERLEATNHPIPIGSMYGIFTYIYHRFTIENKQM